jgi:hypothetical protein
LIASFGVPRDSPLQGDMTIGSQTLRRCSGTNELRVLGIFEVPIFIGEDQIPTELSEMTPGIDNHSAIKRLSLCRDHQTIVLAPCAGVRFAPVKLKSFELQRIERNKQVRRPLVTVAAFPEPVIDKKIVKDWRTKHLVLAPEPIRSRVGALRQSGRFRRIHSG